MVLKHPKRTTLPLWKLLNAVTTFVQTTIAITKLALLKTWWNLYIFSVHFCFKKVQFFVAEMWLFWCIRIFVELLDFPDQTETYQRMHPTSTKSLRVVTSFVRSSCNSDIANNFFQIISKMMIFKFQILVEKLLIFKSPIEVFVMM